MPQLRLTFLLLNCGENTGILLLLLIYACLLNLECWIKPSGTLAVEAAQMNQNMFGLKSIYMVPAPMVLNNGFVNRFGIGNGVTKSD